MSAGRDTGSRGRGDKPTLSRVMGCAASCCATEPLTDLQATECRKGASESPDRAVDEPPAGLLVVEGLANDPGPAPPSFEATVTDAQVKAYQSPKAVEAQDSRALCELDATRLSILSMQARTNLVLSHSLTVTQSRSHSTDPTPDSHSA